MFSFALDDGLYAVHVIVITQFLTKGNWNLLPFNLSVVPHLFLILGAVLMNFILQVTPNVF